MNEKESQDENSRWHNILTRLGKKTITIDCDALPAGVNEEPELLYENDPAGWLSRACDIMIENNSRRKIMLVVLDFNKAFWHDETPQACLESCLDVLRIPFSAFTSEDVVRRAEYPPLPDEYGLMRPHTIQRQSTASNSSGIAWNYCPATRATIGIAWAVDSEGRNEVNYILQQATSLRFFGLHRYFLGTLALQAMTIEMQGWVRGQRLEVLRAQLLSGFHAYKGPKTGKRAANLDYSQLSAHVSGLASNIVTSENCLQGLQDLASSILEDNNELENLPPGTIADDTERLKQTTRFIDLQTRHWRKECVFLQREAVAWERKARILVQGLFNLIAQRDQSTNIEIARDSKTLAEQSQRVAEATQKDSTSMKAIAVVTMCFLPGTFVASFFSMPMFELDAVSDTITTHQFWLYWAITAPLTIATICTWIVWNRLMNKHSFASLVRMVV